MISISPKKLIGPWKSGYALDRHIISSEFIGENEYGFPQFDTKRSEMGELLYRLKYKQDRAAVTPAAKALKSFLEKQGWPIEMIIPVPPSAKKRSLQPVIAVSKEVAKYLEVVYCSKCVRKIKETPELKNILDYTKRVKILRDAIDSDPDLVESRRVLVIDDLYQSGATLECIARALKEQGKAKVVYVTTFTRSR